MTATAFEPVIGLEVHVELSTASKMFCGCATRFGSEPNTQVCPVCLGMPGTLPVPNARAIEYAIRIGLALGCDIAPSSIFHRKNYFYPDMPKNYQISQYDLPICVNGALEVIADGEVARIGVTRAHLEEDTGKSLHVGATGRIADARYSLVDYNRAGIPLVEIVSEPDVRTAAQAQAYLSDLRAILLALGVSDVRMDEGSMRCDANISMRPTGQDAFGTKVEIKNLNSIRSVGRAITFEIARQTRMLEAGETVAQETRHFDEGSGKTDTMRSKEEAFDYRYFPEPDLLPIEPSLEWIAQIRGSLAELPTARRERLATEHGLDVAQTAIVAASVESVAYFDALRAAGASARDAAVWMAGELARAQNAAGHAIAEATIAPADLAALIAAVADGSVNLATAKKVFQEAYPTGRPPMEIVSERGLTQVSDTGAVQAAVDAVIAEHAGEVERFRAGEEKVFGFLVGQVMRALRGQGSPAVVNEVLRAALTNQA